MKRLFISIIILIVIGAGLIIWNMRSDSPKEEATTKTEQSSPNNETNHPGSTEKQDTEQQKDNEETMQLQLPISAFLDMSEEEIKEQLQQDGAKNIVINNDEITYEIETEIYTQKVSTMKSQIEDMVNQLNDQTIYPSVKSAKVNEDYTLFQLTVDRPSYEDSFDSLAVFSLMTSVAYYFNYQGDTDYKLTMQLIDETNNEVFQEELYPQQD